MDWRCSPRAAFIRSSWTGKWWGGEKAYSLVVELAPGLQHQRLSLVTAVDQSKQPAQVLEHRAQDYNQQALFLQPSPGATSLHLTFALAAIRFVQFLARPEFVQD